VYTAANLIPGKLNARRCICVGGLNGQRLLCCEAGSVSVRATIPIRLSLGWVSGRGEGGRIDGVHWVRIGGRFGTERVHCSGLPPVPLSRLPQAVQPKSGSWMIADLRRIAKRPHRGPATRILCGLAAPVRKRASPMRRRSAERGTAARR
jgi:hypothetical protein